ncbi:MAG: mechanosensitive ion channel [Putridiphycobacter sp.]|nr:mechanosensitive ion channel [Putridiphycobacter sp.]
MGLWDDILNFPLVDTRKVINEGTDTETITGFIFSPINIIVFVAIFLAGKLLLKYLKRYFKILQLDSKHLTIEGREIALWKLIKQVVYFIVFYACFQSLNINNTSIDFANVLTYELVRIGAFHLAIYHLFLTAFVLFIARIFINFIKLYLLKRVAKRAQIDQGTEFVIIQLAKYIIYTIAIIVILQSFGLSMSLLLGGSAALLVGVGLGMQDIFKDFIAGLLLLFEGSNKVGDIVEINNYNGESNFIAKIKQINLRTTKVETRDNKTLIIPNSTLTHQSVNNWSFSTSIIRFQIPVTIHYNSDVDLAKDILVQCAQAHPRVKNTQPVFVRLINFGKDGLELDLVFWAEQNFYIDIYKSEIRFAIEREFRKHNISFPYPQTDVHIKRD